MCEVSTAIILWLAQNIFFQYLKTPVSVLLFNVNENSNHDMSQSRHDSELNSNQTFIHGLLFYKAYELQPDIGCRYRVGKNQRKQASVHGWGKRVATSLRLLSEPKANLSYIVRSSLNQWKTKTKKSEKAFYRAIDSKIYNKEHAGYCGAHL